MMNEILATSSLLPVRAKVELSFRVGTMADIAFMDELQKKNNRSLGFMHRATLEGKIKREEVLIAEERVVSSELPVLSPDSYQDRSISFK